MRPVVILIPKADEEKLYVRSTYKCRCKKKKIPNKIFADQGHLGGAVG